MPEPKKSGPMRIAYHLGAHCTDEDRLVRCHFAGEPGFPPLI